VTSGTRTILLTGGSGLIGQALLEKLTGVSVICLVRRNAIDAPHVTTVRGDVCEPRFGLSSEQFNDLCHRVDYVVHSAATTSFTDTKAATFRTNVEGTRHVLELAARANVPFCHLSTAFAHLPAQEGTQPNFYEASKAEAENVVRSSGVPHVILRPSVVIGDSHDGRMARFQGFQFLCELMLRGVVPVWVPTTPEAYMDFVPQDIVANAVIAAVQRPDLRGEYWITAGPRALQVKQAVTLWETHLPRLTGRTVKSPKYVDPGIIDRLVRPVFLPSLPARTQMMLNQALELMSFSVLEPLPTSLPDLEARFDLPRMPDPELSLIRNAEFWARKRGFAQLRGGVSPVGA
jgi:nucleoside-diphosphate-sugar epimerase